MDLQAYSLTKDWNKVYSDLYNFVTFASFLHIVHRDIAEEIEIEIYIRALGNRILI